MSIEWKACVVAHNCQARQIELTVNQLQQSGWEEFLLYSPRGTKAIDRQDVSVCRCMNMHESDEYIDYDMMYTALDGMTTSFMRSANFLIFAKPGFLCWEQLQHYCEEQLEPSRLAVYSVYTPDKLIESERIRRPVAFNGDGFYRVAIADRLLSADLLVMTPSTAKLVLTQLPHPSEKLYQTFAHAMGVLAHQMPAVELYYHIRSLARKEEETCDDFVGVGYSMPNSELTSLKSLNVWNM